MRALRFFFPIAFRLSNNGRRLTWNIIIHAAILILYFVISAAIFILSLPVWIVLFLIPILKFIFIPMFIAILFLLFVVGIVMPFYCLGGILLGILNYRKILSVLEDAPIIE